MSFLCQDAKESVEVESDAYSRKYEFRKSICGVEAKMIVRLSLMILSFRYASVSNILLSSKRAGVEGGTDVCCSGGRVGVVRSIMLVGETTFILGFLGGWCRIMITRLPPCFGGRLGTWDGFYKLDWVVVDVLPVAARMGDSHTVGAVGLLASALVMEVLY